MKQHWKLKATSLALATILMASAGGAASAATPGATKKSVTKCDNAPFPQRIRCLAEMGKVSVWAVPFIVIVGHSVSQKLNGVDKKVIDADSEKHMDQFIAIIQAIGTIEANSPTAKAELKRLEVKANKELAKLVLYFDEAAKKIWALSQAIYYGTMAVSRFADFISDPGLHKALDDINKGFEEMDSGLKQMNRGVSRVNQSLEQMNKGFGKASAGLKETKHGIADANKGLDKLNKAARGIAKGADRLNDLPNLKGIDFSKALKGIVTGKSPLDDMATKIGMSAILDLVPGIGDAKGILEGITGKDEVTGQQLSGTDRLIGSVVLLRWMKAGKKVIKAEDLSKAMKAEKVTGKVDGWLSREAYDKVPSSLKEYETLNRKGIGYRWNDGKGNGIRIDKGERGNPQPYQQVDHVVINSGGKIIGRDGKAISGSIKDHPRAAHIPVTEWVKWKAWNKP